MHQRHEGIEGVKAVLARRRHRRCEEGIGVKALTAEGGIDSVKASMAWRRHQRCEAIDGVKKASTVWRHQRHEEGVDSMMKASTAWWRRRRREGHGALQSRQPCHPLSPDAATQAGEGGTWPMKHLCPPTQPGGEARGGKLTPGDSWDPQGWG